MPTQISIFAKEPKPAPTQEEAERVWVEIERLTHEACLLRKEGQEEKAAHLLGEKLPPILKHWASLSGLPAETRKERLRLLIASAQKKVEEALVQRRLIVDEVMKRLSEGQRDTVSRPWPQSRQNREAPAFQLRRRIPIHDISGMLDALQESETGRGYEEVQPARPLFQPALAF